MVRRTALGLTPRQELYLRGMCNGERRKETATNAGRSDGAVRCGLTKAYRTLRVRNAAEACYVLGIFDQRAGGGDERGDGNTVADYRS
jgi:DNA-binding NarL/FixJ family response regulator